MKADRPARIIVRWCGVGVVVIIPFVAFALSGHTARQFQLFAGCEILFGVLAIVFAFNPLHGSDVVRNMDLERRLRNSQKPPSVPPPA